MGLISLGPPEKILTELTANSDYKIFIETGTFRGGTTKWAAKRFDKVFTIERAETIFNLHHPELSAIKGVKHYLGDSRDLLPKILNEIGDSKAVFWLDGHYSGGETAGIDDECPVLDELKTLAGRSEDIILIDDARLFLSVPPLPHKPSEWPTITEIIETLYATGKKPFVQIIDDVIFILPDTEPLKSIMINYSQKRAIPFWHRIAEKRYDLSKDGLKTKLLKIKNRIAGSD